jgi:predicted nucleotidyltransferase
MKRLKNQQDKVNRKGRPKRKDKLGLLETLFKDTQISILSLLYGHTDESFHLRKIRRLTGLLPGAAQRELKSLSEAGIILRTARDNQVLFQANSRCPIFTELRNIIMKTVGMADVLRDALLPFVPAIRVAGIFGSIAQGRENKESDVDLLIIGEVSFGAVIEKLNPVQTLLNREVNPVVMSVDEFKRRRVEKEHFITAVLEKPLIPVVGDIREFVGLG